MAKTHVCPVEKAKSLDSRLRRWLQNPQRILQPYIKQGMTVMDLGCGPGFFTLEMAERVGDDGHIIAVDLQEGMLEKLRKKIEGLGWEKRITLHQCEEDQINVTQKVDFILAFYVVHEVPDQAKLFEEMAGILSDGGRILFVEPPFHVSKKAFRATLEIAETAGFAVDAGPMLLFSKTAVLTKMGRESR